MIYSIIVTNYQNQSIELDLRRPEESGFVIFNITGIGPGSADILTTDLVIQDGSIYNMSRRTRRTINLTIKNIFVRRNDKIVMNEEDTRQLTYKYFPVKKPVTLTFKTNNRTATILGYVESNEPVIFTNQVHTQISILCPDPNFYSHEIMITTFEGVVSMFEFPFSNESLTENLLILGEIWPAATRSVFYQGDVEVGVELMIFSRGNVAGFVIFNYDNPTERMSINDERLISLTGSGIKRDDKIVISTIRGQKSITLFRENKQYNILNALNRDAFWFQLRKGDNIFAYAADTGIAHVIFRIENRIAYEGL